MKVKNNKNTGSSENTELVESILHVGRADEKTIEGWKLADYKPQCLQVQISENEISYGYFKAPERIVIAKAYTELVKGDIVKCGEIVFNNCWLDGDPRMKNVEDINLAACIQLTEVIQFKNTKLGKL